MTAALSLAGTATAVTGIGALASVLLGAVAAIAGVSSMLLTEFSKKIQHKLTKHEKLYTLAFTKKNTVTELVSKALNDNTISDSEFYMVLRELEKFNDLKTAIRVESSKKYSYNNNAQPNPQPATDVEQIKMQLRKEIKKKVAKKRCFQI